LRPIAFRELLRRFYRLQWIVAQPRRAEFARQFLRRRFRLLFQLPLLPWLIPAQFYD
jgi:hypothetical protein